MAEEKRESLMDLVVAWRGPGEAGRCAAQLQNWIENLERDMKNVEALEREGKFMVPGPLYTMGVIASRKEIRKLLGVESEKVG